MAYVAINSAFLGRVEERVAGMCTAELNTLGNPPIPAVTQYSDFFLDNVWGEHRALINVLPDEYKQDTSEWRISINIGEHNYKIAIPSKAFGAAFPPNFSWYSHATVNYDLGKYPELKDIIDYFTSYAEIQDRWDDAGNKVVAFLRECKSLNEAIKLWPDLKIYIDPIDINRMEVKHEKSTRVSKAAETLAGLDTEQLLGTAVIARLSGAEL